MVEGVAQEGHLKAPGSRHRGSFVYNACEGEMEQEMYILVFNSYPKGSLNYILLVLYAIK